MSTITFTRRAALAATFAFVAPAAILPLSAAARRSPIGGVRVDVGPLLENSGEPTAGWVAQELPSAIAAALANAGQAGTTVSVRIDYVLLGPNSGGVAGPSPDQMIGEVTTRGVTRPLSARTSYFPSGVDNAMIEQSNHRRVSQLVQAFAYWIGKGY